MSFFNKRYLKIYALANQVAVQRRDLFGSEIPTSGKVEQMYVRNSLIEYLKRLETTTTKASSNLTNNTASQFIHTKLDGSTTRFSQSSKKLLGLG